MSGVHTLRATTERSKRTELGYGRFRCRDCHRGFNERSGMVFNHLQYPTDVVYLVVLWRLRYALSLRNLVEMFALQGFVFTHEAVREWEVKLAPHLTEEVHKARRGKVGRSWYTERRAVHFHPREEYEVLKAARARMTDPAWQERYHIRAGVEGTLSQGIRAFGMRQSRYIGLAKPSLQQVCITAAMSVLRVVYWLDGRPRAKTCVTRFAALAKAA